MTDLSVASHTNINTNTNHEEIISLNETFASKLIRLTFPMPILQEVFKKEKVESDRGYLVEAQIIKFMKARKALDMTTLTQEVLASITMFHPQPKLIKVKVESLIERQFLKRDDNDKTLIIYLP